MRHGLRRKGMILLAGSIRLAEELPQASLKVIEDCGYLPHAEQPEQFMQAVRSFLETIPEG